MALIVRHKKVSALADTPDAALVQASDWNDTHEILNEPAVGGSVVVVQASGLLGQGDVLTINHAADLLHRRLVLLVREIGGAVSVGENLIPIMTSNTEPSGVASSSSYLGAGYEPFRAFDGQIVSFFSVLTPDLPSWLRYSFQNAVTVGGYSIGRRMDTLTAVYGAGYYPQSWRLQHSNDEATWFDADVRAGVSFESPTQVFTRSFDLAAPITARHWRVLCEAAAGASYFQTHGFELRSAVVSSPGFALANAADYVIALADDATIITRVSVGSEQLTASVWLP